MNPDNYNAAVKENRDRRRQAEEDARREVEQTNATFSTGESLSSSNVPETDHGTPIESQTYREEVVQRQELGETNKETVINDSQNTLRVMTDSAEPTEEMIIPCITIHAQKGIVDTKDVRLLLVTSMNKITNLMVHLDFLQEEPVSDTVKPLNARIRFEAEDGEVISNEALYKAEDPRERMFKLRFDIKRKTYSQEKKYFLRVIDDKKKSVVMERQVIIDLPFTDNFGF